MPRLQPRLYLHFSRSNRRRDGRKLAIGALAVRIALVLPAGSVTGCGENGQIVQYQVPKETVSVAPDRGAAPFAGQAADAAGQRMLAAILPAEQKTWFFKITGPNKQVAAEVNRFETFLKSVRIESGQPPKLAWTLPDNWTEKPGTAFRYATIEIGTDGRPLEMSVSSLDTGSDVDQYVLDNVNRWRGQMGLPPIDSTDPSDELRRIELDSGLPANVVNLVGQSTADAASASTRPIEPRPPVAASGVQLTYDVPEGWTEGESGGIRRAAFRVTEGDQQVEITVIDLPPSGLMANVNRWRGQVQLAPMSDEQLDQNVEEIEIDGLPGQFIELVGPQDASRPETILGVMVTRQDKAWFFKLKGDSELASREAEAFRSFVRSVRFTSSGSEGAGDGQ